MDDIPKLPHMFHFSICLGCWGFISDLRILLYWGIELYFAYQATPTVQCTRLSFWRQQLHLNFPSQMIESRSHIICMEVSNTLALGLSLKPETIVGAGGQVYDHVNTSSLTNGF